MQTSYRTVSAEIHAALTPKEMKLDHSRSSQVEDGDEDVAYSQHGVYPHA